LPAGDGPAGQIGQSAGLTAVWISLVAVSVVAVVIVGGILLAAVRRRRGSRAPMNEAETETETDFKIACELENSLSDWESLLSGENALSHDRRFSIPNRMNDGDFDESFLIPMGIIEGPDFTDRDWSE
jgi:hypothetical protein